MVKFRKRPEVVEAYQWFPGMESNGVREHKPELIFSADGEYYYLSALGDGTYADAWLAVEPGKPKNGDILPFVFWKCKSGRTSRAAQGEALTERYLSYLKKGRLPESYAMVETPNGTVTVRSGDWIIENEKGETWVWKPDIFEATYEPVEDTPPTRRRSER